MTPKETIEGLNELDCLTPDVRTGEILRSAVEKIEAAEKMAEEWRKVKNLVDDFGIFEPKNVDDALAAYHLTQEQEK